MTVFFECAVCGKRWREYSDCLTNKYYLRPLRVRRLEFSDVDSAEALDSGFKPLKGGRLYSLRTSSKSSFNDNPFSPSA